MIIWITGKRGAGKTTLAKQMQAHMKNAVLLDGDDMRASISTDLGFTDQQRLKHNLRVARLAKTLEKQGFPVIVATICPPSVREEVYFECKPRWIHL